MWMSLGFEITILFSTISNRFQERMGKPGSNIQTTLVHVQNLNLFLILISS